MCKNLVDLSNVGLYISLVYTSVIAHSGASTRCKGRTFNLSPSLSLMGVCGNI